MKSKQIHKTHGFTLIECMVVLLILMVTFGGIMSFRYYAVLSAERAETELLAARAATTISEAWRARRGAADFDPTEQSFSGHFQISSANMGSFNGISSPGTQELGMYQVEVEGRRFQANLFYRAGAVPNTRLLHVVLSWRDGKKTAQQFHLSTLTQT